MGDFSTFELHVAILRNLSFFGKNIDIYSFDKNASLTTTSDGNACLEKNFKYNC